MKRLIAALTVLALTALVPLTALASEGAHHLNGGELSIFWIIPFVCMLLSIAIGPLAAPHFWEHHFGKVAVFWSLIFLIPFTMAYGLDMAKFQLAETVLLDYLPFIILLLALFTIAGGVRLTGSLVGTPKVNVALLAIGTILASWMGTTGAAMLLIRPLLRANAHRKYRVHSVVFFIFLVANIGGSLTPLGDPPLFLGFLKGVSFFWTTIHLFCKTALLSLILLALFFVIDFVLYKKEGSPVGPTPENPEEKLGLEGKVNFIFLGGVVVSVLVSGLITPETFYNVTGVEIPLTGIVRDVCLLLLAVLSLIFTSSASRQKNGFTWAPILEVAKLFIGIFITMIPAIAILKSGTEGALSGVINMVSHDGQPVNYMYFWLTGLLSSFLDNAPTYLVFFNTAGGDAVHLMGEWANTLAAISAGAVFMGAITYIGNAPNFMVRSIAEEQGVKMPSFFGYMVWSIGILYPCFILITWLFF